MGVTQRAWTRIFVNPFYERPGRLVTGRKTHIMNASRTKVIINLIEQAITRTETFTANCKGSDNPQVIEMRLRAEGRIATLEDVLYAIKGDITNLRILAKGTIS